MSVFSVVWLGCDICFTHTPPLHPLQTHRKHSCCKLQPGVTPQVQSVLFNLRSTVKVATMRLQGPHAIYRDLPLCIPPSLHPSLSPHLPTGSSHALLKLFYLEAIKWQTRSEVLQCDRKDILFSVPAALSTSLHFFFFCLLGEINEAKFSLFSYAT